jgi:hypothetical protein
MCISDTIAQQDAEIQYHISLSIQLKNFDERSFSATISSIPRVTFGLSPEELYTSSPTRTCFRLLS